MRAFVQKNLVVITGYLFIAIMIAMMAAVVGYLVAGQTSHPDGHHNITVFIENDVLHCFRIDVEHRIAYDCLGSNNTRFSAVTLGTNTEYAFPTDPNSQVSP